MDPLVKDCLQALAWIATFLAAVIAAFKFATELRQGREQRARELRWQQAKSAKELVDEMLSTPSVINRNRKVFDDFLTYYRLNRAAAFLKRMDRELGEAAKPIPNWRVRDATNWAPSTER
jgi:hypothetical protein